MPATRDALVSIDDLYSALEACTGNKTQMAARLGVHRETVRKLLLQYGIGNKPVVGGYVKPSAINKLPVPAQGGVHHYLLTCAQNNTKVFMKFWENLVAYKDFLSGSLMVSRFSYNKNAYENAFHDQAKGHPNQGESEMWYDPCLAAYVCDDPALHGSAKYQLAPDLVWCSNLNIQPTFEDPLAGKDAYGGAGSAIFPHAKVAMKSVPRMPGDKPRFLYSTGTVTQMNYIQRNAGQKAEFHHIYGALLVEVDSNGDWWARQINASADGSFYDCPKGQVVHVRDGQVFQIEAENKVAAINWGDVHASEIDPVVKIVNWGCFGKGGTIDALRPKHQLMHDLLSFRSQNHHDRGKFAVRYDKYLKGQDLVQEELDATAGVLSMTERPFCKTVVVCSNHDRHGERWLDEADYRHDLPNAHVFVHAQASRIDALRAGRDDWTFIEWGLATSGRYCFPRVKFLRQGESYLVGPRGHQVECGLHGDKGPNGARGSTRNLSTLGRRNNKGHDHQATIYQGTYSAGACQLEMGYNNGEPTSWSVSHIVTYLNGKRTILTQRAGKLWAE